MKKSIYSSKSSVCYLLGLIYYTGISEKTVFCLENEYLGSSLLMPGIKFLQRYCVIYFLKICGVFFEGEEAGRGETPLFSCGGESGRAALGQ